MYRIFILSFLAIVFATFAVEPSQIILRATEIRGDAMVLEWSPIEGAAQYKVFYDEATLVNPKAPDPMLESPTTDKTRIEITKMLEGAEYYFIVRGYDAQDVEVGKTIPLHASTLNIPVFGLKEAKVIDDQHIQLSFSRPVDIAQTQIEIMNTETKNVREQADMQSSVQDLRIIDITLRGKLELGVSHDVVLKKVTNTAGETLPLDASKKTTITFAAAEQAPVSPVVAPVIEAPTVTTVAVAPPVTETLEEAQTVDTSAAETSASDVALADLKKDVAVIAPTAPETSSDNIALLPLEIEEDIKTPVPIDKLPQTGAPAFVFLLMALTLGTALSYKKKTSV
ncbi:MAG: hypothetical protein WC753_00585 [Candidatus Gracilibacteria bacterium]